MPTQRHSCWYKEADSNACKETIIAAHYGLRDAVALITLDNPPVNGLGFETRAQIAQGIDRALADSSAIAIVLTGAGKLFSGGADIREFNTPKATAEPTLHTLIRLVESATKPTIAAINGACMGGGLELALGCHYRVASASATVGLPEVRLGLLPGAGGTQRLPRAIGVEAALNMIVTGAAVAAKDLAQTSLFDKVVDGNVIDAALELARDVVEKAQPLKRLRDVRIDYPNADGFFAFARNTVSAVAKNLPAPLKCVEAVSAAVSMPFEEGVRFERSLFLQLVQTPESHALRHAFFAERAASKIPDVPEDTPARPIRRVAVIGAGTMGGGIAMNFLSAGLPVTLLEMNSDALDRGVATIRKNYETSVAKRKLTQQKHDAAMALLTPTLRYDDVKDADLVVEAVFEEMEIKQNVFRELDRVTKNGAILATNTSTLDIDRIAEATSRPQDVVGMHFFSPANVMKLLEVVRAEKTAKDVLKTVMDVARTIRKTAVVARVCDGFIGNRMVEHYLRQAMFLVEEGASPQQVDRALERFGMAMGPFRMSDLAGNDVGWRIRKRRYVEKPKMRYSRIADRLCELGRFGQKTGAGWYRYEAGRRDPIADPPVDELIAGYRKEIGVTPRKIPDDEIVDRLILALVNEGARLLDEGIALRASDLDVVYVTGYGFPVYRGGPMFYADSIGLYNVVRRMKQLAAIPRADADFWQPAPSIEKLAAEGKTLT